MSVMMFAPWGGSGERACPSLAEISHLFIYFLFYFFSDFAILEKFDIENTHLSHVISIWYMFRNID